MHRLSSKYRAPVGRLTKRKKAAALNIQKRWLQNNELQLQESTSSVDVPSTSSNVVYCSSESEKKLQTFSNVVITENEFTGSDFTLVGKDVWKSLLKDIPCTKCSSYALEICVNSESVFGFSSKLKVHCCECDIEYGETFSSTRISQSRMFEANKRMVEAFLSMGKGHASMEKFCMKMGMHVMDKRTFANCLAKLSEEGKQFKLELLRMASNAVRESYAADNNLSAEIDSLYDITVSYDGTWHKRGHTSNLGLGLVIDTVTGLVIDFEILSKYCNECVAAKRDLHEGSAEFEFWYQGHSQSDQCEKNFNGSANAMEMTAALHIWERSQKCFNLRYKSVVSDGDAKTVAHLNKNKPYGDNFDIQKEECLNHVAKRLVSGLENKIKECKAKGITLGGRKCGSLKKETIIKLSNFYRKAIKDNAPDINKMKNAIYATLYHCMSTDKKPQHQKCPPGVNSWCFFNRAAAKEEAAKSHMTMKTRVTEFCVGHIMPVYQRLASDELLHRCISSKTQNANESVHSLIWSKCPKENFIGKKRLELAVLSAVGEFNMGCLTTNKVQEYVRNQEVSAASQNISAKRDERRLKQSCKRTTAEYREQRISAKRAKLSVESKKKNNEGPTYSAGQF